MHSVCVSSKGQDVYTQLKLNGFRLKSKVEVLNGETNEKRGQVTAPPFIPITTNQKLPDIALEPTMEAPVFQFPTPLEVKSKQRSTKKQKLSKEEKILNKLPKMELLCAERNAFVKSFPSTFLLKAMTTFKDFLSNENADKLVLVPRDGKESRFYTIWSTITSYKTVFDEEYKELYDRIIELFRVTSIKQKRGVRNVIYGFREVVYTKKLKWPRTPKGVTPTPPPPFDAPITPQWGSKKLNNKLKKLANLDTSTESIQTAKDRSFRNKKKNKKQRRQINNSSTNKLTCLSSTRTYLQPLQNDPSNSEDAGSESSRSQSSTTLDRPPTLPPNIRIDFEPARSEWTGSDDSSRQLCRSHNVTSTDRTSATSQQQTTDKESSLQADIASRKRHLTVVNSEYKEVPDKLTKWKIFKRKPEPEVRRDKLSRRKNRVDRNEKLIELLSRPVQCDKALKMMQGMGWRGGGLGARGTGIIEPIMPVIDGLSRACLGHGDSTSRPRENRSVTEIGGNWDTEDSTEQSQTHQNDYIVEKTKEILGKDFSIETLTKKFVKKLVSTHKKKSPIRQVILRNILQLLSTDETSRVVTFEKPLFKNDMRFLLNGINGLGDMPLKKLPNVEQGMVKQVIKKYEEIPGVTVIAKVVDEQKVVQLTKQQTCSEVQKKQVTKPRKPIIYTAMEGGDECSVFLEDILLKCHSKKDLRVVMFKALILLKILIFIKSEDSEMDVIFHKVLTDNQRTVIESSVVAVNSREQFGNSQIESALMVEIKKRIGDYFLGIIFNHKYTSFTLTKHYPIMLTKTAGTTKPKHATATIDLDGSGGSLSGNTDLEENNAKENNNIKTACIENVNNKKDKFFVNNPIEDCVIIDDSDDDYTDYVSSDEDEVISTDDNINIASDIDNSVIIIDSDDSMVDDDDIIGTANKTNEATHKENSKDEKIKSVTTDITKSINNQVLDNNCNVANNHFIGNKNNGIHKNIVTDVCDIGDDEHSKIIYIEHNVTSIIKNNENKTDVQNNEVAETDSAEIIEITGNLNVDHDNYNQDFDIKNDVIDSQDKLDNTKKNIYEREDAANKTRKQKNKETVIADLEKVIIENTNNEINVLENYGTKSVMNSKKVAIVKQKNTDHNEKAIGNTNEIIDITENDDTDNVESDEIVIINEDIGDDNESLVIDKNANNTRNILSSEDMAIIKQELALIKQIMTDTIKQNSTTTNENEVIENVDMVTHNEGITVENAKIAVNNPEQIINRE